MVKKNPLQLQRGSENKIFQYYVRNLIYSRRLFYKKIQGPLYLRDVECPIVFFPKIRVIVM
jgi:hypothetical protein